MPFLGDTDAVTVGHHGSRYASTPVFVAAVHPRIAVISVGRYNTFGHPSPATIEAWQHAGADVLRTDLCEAISLADGPRATMLHCAPSEIVPAAYGRLTQPPENVRPLCGPHHTHAP
jgi:beta-lactamase superfamily II metal-dependent hydrolase